jgi:hypothetical protein
MAIWRLRFGPLNGGLPSGAATASGVRLLVFGGDHIDSGAATGTLNPSRVMPSASSTRQPVNRRGRRIRRKTWETALDGAVNKRFLSTGETGELVLENVGFGLNPGVELAPPRSLLSNWRDRRASNNLRNVADTGDGGGWRCRQDNGRGIWYADRMAPRRGFEPELTEGILLNGNALYVRTSLLSPSSNSSGQNPSPTMPSLQNPIRRLEYPHSRLLRNRIPAQPVLDVRPSVSEAPGLALAWFWRTS